MALESGHNPGIIQASKKSICPHCKWNIELEFIKLTEIHAEWRCPKCRKVSISFLAIDNEKEDKKRADPDSPDKRNH